MAHADAELFLGVPGQAGCCGRRSNIFGNVLGAEESVSGSAAIADHSGIDFVHVAGIGG